MQKLGECRHCGSEVFEDDGNRHYFEHIFLCRSCLRSVSMCERQGCTRTISRWSFNQRCRDHLPRCENCGERFDAEFCENCGEGSSTRSFIKPFDWDPLHSVDFQGNPKNGLYFGVEYEIEPTVNKYELARQITEDFPRKVVCVHDGSLMNGFEAVTAPMPFRKQIKFWKQFFEKDYQYESFKSDRCSIHVHMSRKAFTPMQIAKLKVFCYAKNNREFIEKIAGRQLQTGWGHRYAKLSSEYKITDLVEIKNSDLELVANYLRVPKEKIPYYMSSDEVREFVKKKAEIRRLPRSMVSKKTDRDRYHAINLENEETVEFRIFRGCNKLSTMLKNIEFCQALYDFTLSNKVGISKLTDATKQFIKYVKTYSRDYPHLFKYIAKHIGV